MSNAFAPQQQAAPPIVVSAPQSIQPRERLSTKERNKRDAEEAERILSQHYAEGIYTFPGTGVRVGIREIPEAAYQRFFMDENIPPLPNPPNKKVKGKRGKDVLVPDYDNEGYIAQVRAYNSHNSNTRQAQAGKMMRYIYGKGTVVELPKDWVDEYMTEYVGDDDDEPTATELKIAYLTEQATSNAELKALNMSICGRDPMGYNLGDDDEDDEDE